MRITPGASFGVVARAVNSKHKAIARCVKERKRKSFSRNATKLREEEVMRQLSSNEKISAPIPAVLLSNEQWEAQKDVSMVLNYDGAVKDNKENCWRPKWDVAWKGGRFSASEGSLVFDVDSMGLDQQPQDRIPFFRSVVIEGSPLPSSSGKIVLATWGTANFDEDDIGGDEAPVYTSDILESVGLDKKSITPLNGKRHHGSCGFHFGYGSVASYGSLKSRTEGNSVCVFAGNNKHEPTLARSVAIGTRCIDGKFKCNNIPGSSVTTKGTIMTHSVKRGALNANPLLHSHVVNIKGTRFPAVFLCVDAFTLRKHTERDCSYTLITVPKQECLRAGDASGYFFNFYLNNKAGDLIEVPMQLGISIFFSGFFLTHNQSRTVDHVATFVNISAYGNQKFFQSAQCTIMRNT